MPMRRSGRGQSHSGWDGQQHQSRYQYPTSHSSSSSSSSPRQCLVATNVDPADGSYLPPLIQYFDPVQGRNVFVPGPPVRPQVTNSGIIYYHQHPRDAIYNEHEALRNQLGGMSIVGPNYGFQPGNVVPPLSRPLQWFYPHTIVTEDGTPLQQQQQQQQQSLLEPQQEHVESWYARWASVKEAAQQDDRIRMNLFEQEWTDRHIIPHLLSSQALANEVLRIQASLSLRSSISTILKNFVEPQLHQDVLPAFRKRLRYLWLKYETIRAMRKYPKPRCRSLDESSELECRRREHDAEVALERAGSSTENDSLSPKDRAAIELHDYLIKHGQDFGFMGKKALANVMPSFLSQLDLSSTSFSSRVQYIHSLFEYLLSLHQSFSSRMTRFILREAKRLDLGLDDPVEDDFHVEGDDDE